VLIGDARGTTGVAFTGIMSLFRAAGVADHSELDHLCATHSLGALAILPPWYA